jgi:hypothetical protein
MEKHRPGSVVGVWKGFYKHVGILTECSTVIASSSQQGCIQEIPIHEFAMGKPTTVEGYPGIRRPEKVVAYARAEIGKPWNLFNSNCERFVRRAHGIVQRSPQLQFAVIAIFALVAVCHLRRALR